MSLKGRRGVALFVILLAVFMVLYVNVAHTNKDNQRVLKQADTLGNNGQHQMSMPVLARKNNSSLEVDMIKPAFRDSWPELKRVIAEGGKEVVRNERQDSLVNRVQRDSRQEYKPKRKYELVAQKILSRLEDVRYDDIRLTGKMPNSTRYLTIGVPTVNRPRVGPLYLLSSLDSLIANSSPRDKARIVVVVYLADKDPAYNHALQHNLTLRYPQYLRDGFMHIIEAPSDFYPDFQNLKRNFGDSEERVKWRSREVLDSAYMYYMCRNLSQYFVQLEDDVLSIPSYLQAVEDYIYEKRSDTWAILDLSAHGSVGKLMRSSDLLKMAIYMFTFYEEQPVDWLMNHFRHTLAQKYAFIRKPIIFQHMGKMSSFKQNGVRDIPQVQSHFNQNWRDVAK